MIHQRHLFGGSVVTVRVCLALYSDAARAEWQRRRPTAGYISGRMEVESFHVARGEVIEA